MEVRPVLILSFCVLLIHAGCARPGPQASFEEMTKEFVESTLALSPVLATASGYHSHNGSALDTLLDDYSASGLDRAHSHWKGWAKRLDAINASTLDVESRADLELMRTQVRLALLDLDTLKPHLRNPTLYVELIGNALFAPYSLNYAPLDARYGHIIARLEAVPAFVESARGNLRSAPPVWKRVAIEENDGTIGLINGPMLQAAPQGLRPNYEEAAKKATDALHGFNEAIAGLKDEAEEAWRLGPDIYPRKFALTMGGTRTPEQALAEAEADLTAIRKRMFELALPLHKRFYPTHRDPVDLNLIVGEVMAKIADDHPSPENYMKAAQTTLDTTRAFLASHAGELLSPPEHDNLKLIETPDFMRGAYGVGGFNPAPPLEPQLGAYYWLTPIPAAWPAARVESKLREYNRYGLEILTIHEAIPGHYVQFSYASKVPSAPRRFLRSIFGSGVYIEGWAVYSTKAILDAGYLNHSPELQITFLKTLLRSVANTILDIKNHTASMTREEGMELMTKKTFQEQEEATAKWQRAQLASCQLPTYYAGYKEWLSLRADVEAKLGASFSAKEFHEKALRAGALPMREIRALFGLSTTSSPPSK